LTRSVFSPAYQRLRDWLIDARHARSLTQAQLAGALGRPQTFVSKYERGERRLDFVEVLEIADALHVDVRDFLNEVGRQAG
jgi:transcriptional regulator with XRE-family HTH domain